MFETHATGNARALRRLTALAAARRISGQYRAAPARLAHINESNRDDRYLPAEKLREFTSQAGRVANMPWARTIHPMKPATAWILLVVAMSGGAYWFATRAQLHWPPPGVAALELTRGDVARSSSCVSVDAVLRANHLDGTEGARPVWTSRVKDEWMMRQEVGQHDWRAFMFRVEGGQLVPINVVYSDTMPGPLLEEAIADLLEHTQVPADSHCARDRSGHT